MVVVVVVVDPADRDGPGFAAAREARPADALPVGAGARAGARTCAAGVICFKVFCTTLIILSSPIMSAKPANWNPKIHFCAGFIDIRLAPHFTKYG